MNKRNLFVRIVAILLCAIMVLGVGTAAISAFAADGTVCAPETGSQPMIWVVVAVVAAIAVIAGCLIIPKVNKK